MSRRPRRDELELWRKVADTTEPLHPERKQKWPETPVAGSKRTAKPAQPSDPLPPFQVGQTSRDRGGAHDLLDPLSARLEQSPVRMDRKAHKKMTRGKLKPEARLDLHGMTMDRAHTALNGFVLRAHREGKRLVLVITGKGRERDNQGPIPERRGALRHQVPHWLGTPPLAQLVLQVTPAHIRHGGGGAYYVYLRRPR